MLAPARPWCAANCAIDPRIGAVQSPPFAYVFDYP